MTVDQVVFSCQVVDLMSVLLDLATNVFWTSPPEVFGKLRMACLDLWIGWNPVDEVLTWQWPCLGLSIHGESVGAGGFDGFRQKQDYAGIYPGSSPGGYIKTYILILYCLYS
jgi:hypothetical protein